MNHFVYMDAVDRLAKKLIETTDPVGDLVTAEWQQDFQTYADYTDVQLADVLRRTRYVSRVRSAFENKFGVSMTAFRTARTGVSERDRVRQRSIETNAENVERAQRLMRRTNLRLRDVAILARFSSMAQLNKQHQYLGLPTPKEYRREYFEPRYYRKAKASRKRIHINGGMRLVMTFDGTRYARMPLTEYLPADRVLLSLTVQTLSFDVSGFITPQRMRLPLPVVIKTSFLTEEADTRLEATVNLPLPDGETYPLTVRYNLLNQEFSLEFNQHAISHIEMTLQLTTTEL